MFRKIVLPLLALSGIAFAVYMMYYSAQRPPEHAIIIEPAQPPYEHYVAGEGLIESYGENTDISPTFPGLVVKLYVCTGDFVKKGDYLFKLDTRQDEVDLAVALSALQTAQTTVCDKRQQFEYYTNLCHTSAVSAQEYARVYYDYLLSINQLQETEARVNQVRMVIERDHIYAPHDGIMLQVNIREGEFANINPFDRRALMVLGDIRTLQLRVNIAEEDAWRVISGAPGMAFVRGNPNIKIPLTFQYIEPLLVPKEQLTGSDIERVDTRVLQVIYTFEKNDNPVYIGQLLDVYLEALPIKTS